MRTSSRRIFGIIGWLNIVSCAAGLRTAGMAFAIRLGILYYHWNRHGIAVAARAVATDLGAAGAKAKRR